MWSIVWDGIRGQGQQKSNIWDCKDEWRMGNISRDDEKILIYDEIIIKMIWSNLLGYKVKYYYMKSNKVLLGGRYQYTPGDCLRDNEVYS